MKILGFGLLNMQRKSNKNTRGPNAEEKVFMAYVKQCPCCVCEKPGPSIVDHCYGATAKQNKIVIGHLFLIPLCEECDQIKTQGNTKRLIIKAGKPLKYLFRDVFKSYRKDTFFSTTPDAYYEIMNFREYLPDGFDE